MEDFLLWKKEFIDFIKDDTQMLEREPLEEITQINQLMAFKHEGFWQCMDNKRDLEKLKYLWKTTLLGD